MERHFCDRCGQEIKDNPEWIFDSELCNDCCEQIKYFIFNEDTIITKQRPEEKEEK